MSSGKNPAPPGAVTFTASVTDPSHPGRVPTGTVAFRVANGLTFLQPLDAQGHASQAIDNLPNGATAITAAYCPDADGFESSSSSVNQTIAQDTTETTELANPQAIRVGETTTLTATVKDIDAPGKTPTGTVQFSDSGGQLIGPPVALQSGSATLATSAIPFGLHNIFASYSSSDGFLGPSTGTVQVAVTRWTSATAFAVQPDHAVAGQPVTLAASVTGSTSTATTPPATWSSPPTAATRSRRPRRSTAPATPPWFVSGRAGSYQLAAHYLGDDYFLCQRHLLHTPDSRPRRHRHHDHLNSKPGTDRRQVHDRR